MQARISSLTHPCPNQLQLITQNRKFFIRCCTLILHQLMPHLPVLAVDSCACGYFASDQIYCINCERYRYYDGTIKPISRSYYFPIRDRVERELKSCLGNLFLYPELRFHSNDSNLVDDIFDCDEYKGLLASIPHGNKLICLALSLDGTVTFPNSTNLMYPLSYKVLNLPPSLRNKVHIGMHLAYLDSESKQCCKILAMELIDLYVNPIVINDTNIHVVVYLKHLMVKVTKTGIMYKVVEVLQAVQSASTFTEHMYRLEELLLKE